MTAAPRRIVVVGGSIAALTAAQTLRMEGFTGQLTLLSEEDRPPYTRVPFSKEFLAGRTPGDSTVLDLPDDVELRLGTRAVSLDAAARQVVTTDGVVPYDGLVIATGARPRRLGHPGELTLRTHHDAVAVRRGVDAAASVLVIGGGFLGMEVASTCVTLGKKVTLVDVDPPLDRLLGPFVAARVRQAARDVGVELCVGSDLRPPADVVVSAVGDLPNGEWLAGSAVVLHEGSVVVDERGRAAPGVVAAGDVAVTRVGDRWVRRPSWTNAVEQARAATLGLLHGDAAPVYRPSGYLWTEQFGHHVKLVGVVGPQGPPDEVVDESGGQLLTWHSGTVIAVNHPIRPARLKRLART